jgi:hypothetical protein
VLSILEKFKDDYLANCISGRCKTHYRYLSFTAAMSNILPIMSVVFGVAVFSLSALSLFTNIQIIKILITCFSAMSFLFSIIPNHITIKNHTTVRGLLWERYRVLLDGYTNGLVTKEEAYIKYKKLILAESKLWTSVIEPSFALEKLLDESES